MLPWSKPRGRKAFKNLKVFIGIPAELGKKELKKLERADVSRLKTKYISLGELAVELGAKKRW
jgi:large subunit ribosomal protein L13